MAASSVGKKRGAAMAGLGSASPDAAEAHAAADLGAAAAAAGGAAAAPLSALTRAYLEHVQGDEAEGPSKKQEEAWERVKESDRVDLVNKAVRLCLLKYGSGAGLVEQAELKKALLEAFDTVAPPVLMREAGKLLLEKFGLQVGFFSL